MLVTAWVTDVPSLDLEGAWSALIQEEVGSRGNELTQVGLVFRAGFCTASPTGAQQERL